MKKIVLLNFIFLLLLGTGLFLIRNLRFQPSVFFEIQAVFSHDTPFLLVCSYPEGMAKVFEKSYQEKKKQGKEIQIKGSSLIKTYRFDLSEILPRGELLNALGLSWKNQRITKIKRMAFKSLLSAEVFSASEIMELFYGSPMIVVDRLLYLKANQGAGNWLITRQWWNPKEQEKIERIYLKVRDGYKRSLSLLYVFLMIGIGLVVNLFVIKNENF